jgi:hypothetical protein
MRGINNWESFFISLPINSDEELHWIIENMEFFTDQGSELLSLQNSCLSHNQAWKVVCENGEKNTQTSSHGGSTNFFLEMDVTSNIVTQS